jgi:hypothetical protein
VKFKRANEMARLPGSPRRLDESEVTLESLGTDVEGVQKRSPRTSRSASATARGASPT